MVMSDSGQDFLAVINPIYNKQGCYTAPCHAHEKSTHIIGLIKTDFSLDEVNRTIFRRRLEVIITVLFAIIGISIVIGLLNARLANLEDEA